MEIGDKIPEMLGIDQDGREIKASDYRGRKIVLYSYPKANTSGCTAEACSLQAHKKELAEAGKLHTYIDKVYSANETTEAIQYLLSNHASGKVVIKIDF